VIFLPAIDLKDGQCVRLLRGEMDQVTVFSDDPVAQAKIFQEAGCSWVHLVDLNGAFEGRPVNTVAIERILAATNIKFELGGGVRDIRTIEMWLSKGVSRVIMGTAALKDPWLVEHACKEFPGQVAVGVDARDGFVAVEGWSKQSDVSALDLAYKFEDVGVSAIIYTDIDRDGVMKGPNIEETVHLARATSIPVIASGGIASMEDLKALRNVAGDLLEGAISGRAVYDGIIDPAAAVDLFESGADA
jgi:phosphoribosylformimino-5-aminoimidazole carboxamide ribotide isomerase